MKISSLARNHGAELWHQLSDRLTGLPAQTGQLLIIAGDGRYGGLASSSSCSGDGMYSINGERRVEENRGQPAQRRVRRSDMGKVCRLRQADGGSIGERHM
jgi:hypothetical protein